MSTLAVDQPSAIAADPLHAWNGATDPQSLTAWTQARLSESSAAIAEIESEAAPRTVANTLRLFDQARALLSLASNETYLLHAVGDSAELRDTAQALSQQVAAQAVALSLNPAVYHALAAVDAGEEDAATQHYLARTLLQYRLSGVDKDEATRAKLRELQDRATELSLAFSRNVQEDVRKVRVAPEALAGLPEDYIARHQPEADGLITITTDQPDLQPVMRYAADANLRRALYLEYNQRGYPVNRQVLLDLLAVRAEIAHILGYECWADLAMADQMMGSSEKLRDFLAQMDEASRGPAHREYEELLAWVRAQRPGMTELTDSDAGYWGELYRRAAYDFDSQSVRPYFPYAQVQQGILDVTARLLGVAFRKSAAPVWHADVAAFEVYDAAGGAHLGRVYLDMHPRDGKDKWFSASSLVPGIIAQQDRAPQLPEACLICNFPAPTSDSPGLLEYNDVVTYFHEFGHLMHYILGSQQRWAGVGGFDTEGDFIEVPSQMLEEFFRDTAILQSFAKHYETGAPIPEELVAQMNRANAYGRGRFLQTQLYYTNFSLETHAQDPAKLDLDALLRATHDRFLPTKFVDGTRMYASFTHLIGYTSNYYTYMYDKVIAIDFYAQFDAADPLGGEAARRYRRVVLEAGGSKPAVELVQEFLGRPQEMRALTEWLAASSRPSA